MQIEIKVRCELEFPTQSSNLRSAVAQSANLMSAVAQSANLMSAGAQSANLRSAGVQSRGNTTPSEQEESTTPRGNQAISSDDMSASNSTTQSEDSSSSDDNAERRRTFKLYHGSLDKQIVDLRHGVPPVVSPRLSTLVKRALDESTSSDETNSVFEDSASNNPLEQDIDAKESYEAESSEYSETDSSDSSWSDDESSTSSDSSEVQESASEVENQHLDSSGDSSYSDDQSLLERSRDSDTHNLETAAVAVTAQDSDSNDCTSESSFEVHRYCESGSDSPCIIQYEEIREAVSTECEESREESPDYFPFREPEPHRRRSEPPVSRDDASESTDESEHLNASGNDLCECHIIQERRQKYSTSSSETATATETSHGSCGSNNCTSESSFQLCDSDESLRDSTSAIPCGASETHEFNDTEGEESHDGCPDCLPLPEPVPYREDISESSDGSSGSTSFSELDVYTDSSNDSAILVCPCQCHYDGGSCGCLDGTEDEDTSSMASLVETEDVDTSSMDIEGVIPNLVSVGTSTDDLEPTFQSIQRTKVFIILVMAFFGRFGNCA